MSGRSPCDAVPRFDRESDQAEFADRINKVTMLWCCITKNVASNDFQQPFPPGHIYYDFWYDRPHKDRWGRSYGEHWDLRVGP